MRAGRASRRAAPRADASLEVKLSAAVWLRLPASLVRRVFILVGIASPCARALRSQRRASRAIEVARDADRRVRPARPDAHALRRARISRRAGADLALSAPSAASRPCTWSRTARISSPSPTRAAGCAAASSMTASRSASPMPRWRRCWRRTASRWRRTAGTTSSRSPTRRHVLCRHRARRPDRALRLPPLRFRGARRADHGAGRFQDASPTTRAWNAWRRAARARRWPAR